MWHVCGRYAQRFETAKKDGAICERRKSILVDEVQLMAVEMRTYEKKIEQQQDTIDHLQKLCDQHANQAVEYNEKVSTSSRRVHCVSVIVCPHFYKSADRRMSLTFIMNPYTVRTHYRMNQNK